MASTVGESVSSLRAEPAEVPARPRAEPVAAAVGDGGLHLAVHRVVDRPDRDRGAVLVQQGRIPGHVAGLLDQVVCRNQVTSVLHNPSLHHAVIQTLILGGLTTVICVPIGVGFAIGIDRWRRRTANGLNFVMIFSFVIPELLLAVALFLLVTQALTFIRLGTPAEVAGLVVWNLSWPAIIVRARLVQHRAELRRGGRGSRGIANGGDPAGTAPAADAGDLRQRRARLRQHRGRFRDRGAAVVDGEHAADVGTDLLQRPWRTERAGAQRAGHDHAVHLARSSH